MKALRFCLVTLLALTWWSLPLRAGYIPDGEDFVCVNGSALFTRALYGGNTDFRVETSDRPNFAFWLPGMGGSGAFFVEADGKQVSLVDAAYVESRYRAGKRMWTVRDPLLGDGELVISLLACYDREGAVWKIESHAIPRAARLGVRYGGASSARFNRNGDMGVDPADAFDLKAANCVGNLWEVEQNRFTLRFGQQSRYGERTMTGLFPRKAALCVRDMALDSPVVEARLALSRTPLYIYIGRDDMADYRALEQLWDATEQERISLASRIVISTPDPCFNALGGALAVAADAIWDGNTWLHGAVGWRTPLAGWRAAYVGDCLGWHDRARLHFNAYAASQVTEVEPVIPHPSQDTLLNMARSEKRWGTQMYSNGYICKNPNRNDQMNHYDMNLNYIDELLWHLQWTGDTAYARQIFPVIERSLEWEKRNFDPDDDGLYDAYCCIWASDALYYSGGAVTHSSAFNLRANRLAAVIADLLGKPEAAARYRAEAEHIAAALDSVLWDAGAGVWAESRDLMGLRRRHLHPALWTIYHAVDNEVGTPAQRHSATCYVDREIPHIPVTAADGTLPEALLLPGDEASAAPFTLSTSSWQPYEWSINNVAFAEVMNMALAYWGAGRYEKGYQLLRSSVLDGMYLGGSPANFGQISRYDVARAESYRDFGDPVGVASRALVQGLFGVLPDRLQGRIVLQPGFPVSWQHASLTTPDISYAFLREGDIDTYTIHLDPTFRAPRLVLRVRAQRDGMSEVTVNGETAAWNCDASAVEWPLMEIPISVGEKGDFCVTIHWEGQPVDISSSGTDRYLPTTQGRLAWIRPAAAREAVSDELGNIGERLFDDVSPSLLEPQKAVMTLFNDSLTSIFRPRYLSPRPPVTTLQIPITGIGEWCHPEVSFEVRDDALRAAPILETLLGVPFAMATEGHNILFTSRWDNFPDSAVVPLTGRATHAYLLMAGTTNAMQSRIANAVLRVRYADDTVDSLLLVNPYNWCPIEQDYYDDGLAFNLRGHRPYRMMLSTGQIARVLSSAVGDAHDQPFTSLPTASVLVDTNTTGLFGNTLPGGAAQLLDLPLHPDKELASLTLETLSNDIVVGLIALTLQRPSDQTKPALVPD